MPCNGVQQTALEKLAFPQLVSKLRLYFGGRIFMAVCQVTTVQSADLHKQLRHDGASKVAVYRDLPLTERRACALSVAPESATVYFHTSSGRAVYQSMPHFQPVSLYRRPNQLPSWCEISCMGVT